MNRHDENDDGIDPRMKLRANAGDKLHDLQLRRDLDIVNGRTANELGPLPPGGLPVAPRRKPNLPASASTMPLPMKAGHQENETMDLRAMAVAASVALAACAPVQDSPGSDEKADEKPLRKLNPNPQRAYTVTMKIEGAPGPFAVVDGVAQYDVENAPECGRYLKFAGVHPDMTSMETFPLTKLSDTEYQGTVYADLVLDEDYFGRGVCRWKFMQAQVVIKATGADAETEFLPYMRADAVYAQESQPKYFWKERYPRVTGYDRFPDFGDETLDPVPVDKRGEFFTITLTSREVQP